MGKSEQRSGAQVERALEWEKGMSGASCCKGLAVFLVESLRPWVATVHVAETWVVLVFG